jgi:gliding motility-associated-like protein
LPDVKDHMTGLHKYGWVRSGFALGILLSLGPIPVFGQLELPDKPDLIRVTVDHADNGVWIEWEASTDTTIDLYHIYRMENGTGTKIFTFSNQTLKYKHMTSRLENLAYTVTAEDTLDGTASRESLLEENEHRAVSVDLEFEPCEPSNTVNWTGYVGWEGKISGYRIYGGIAGTEPRLLKFVNEKTRSYSDKDIEIDTTYIYYVEAVHTSGMTSLSPIDTITTHYPEAPGFLTVDYVSVMDRFTVELQFTADVEGPVNNFRVMRRGSGSSTFTEVETIWNSTQSTRVIQDLFPVINTSYEYIVQALYKPEGCVNPLVISESNPGTSMLLQGTLENQMASLTWTPYKTYAGGLSGYVIQRKSGVGEFVDIHSAGPETTTWREPIESVINGFQPGNLQYKVLAIGNESGNEGPYISVSNIVHIAVETHLKVPSAFTPGSNDMNFEFKPIIDFAPREYTLIIYDRVGRKLFETDDPGEGWDGSFRSGDFVMEGVYVYFIQYTDYTGLSRTISGNVTVIHP